LRRKLERARCSKEVAARTFRAHIEAFQLKRCVTNDIRLSALSQLDHPALIRIKSAGHRSGHNFDQRGF
jgi:hypothetical protein